MRAKRVLILALVMSISTTVMFSKYLTSLENKYKDSGDKVSILVAKTDIAEHKLVTDDMLDLKYVSRDLVSDEVIRNKLYLDNKYSKVAIHANEFLYTYKFGGKDDTLGNVTLKLKDGYIAMSFDSSFVNSVSNLVEPDDYVNITYTEKAETNTANIKSYDPIDNVRVLAVGKSLDKNSSLKSTENNKESTSSTSKTTSTAKDDNYTSITLELLPSDALNLTNLSKKGELKFSLRSKVKDGGK